MKRITKFVSLVLAAMMFLSIQMPLASAKPRISQKSRPSLSLTSKSATSITLKWKEFGDADGYTVYRKTSKNGKWKSIKTTSSTSYTNKKLKLNKTYWYKIRAFEGSGKSKTYSLYSKVKSGNPKLPNPTIKVSSTTTNSIKLSIKKPSGSAGVVIYRKTSSSGKWNKIKTTTSKSYTNKKLKANKTYYYRAKAYKKIGKKTYYSSYTSQIKRKTKAVKLEATPIQHNHKEVMVKGYAATCTKAGLTDGKKCSDCGKITQKQIIIPALGHNYVDKICTICNSKASEKDFAGFIFPEGKSILDGLDFEGKTFTMAIDQHGQYHTKSFNQTVDAFEKQFNCKIVTKELNFTSYNQQVAQYVSAGKAPEICFVHGSTFPSMATMGCYNALTKYITAEDIMDKNNPMLGGLDAEKTSYFAYRGEIYGTCNAKSCFPYVIYYNKKQMADAGFAGNKDPRVLAEHTDSWTWDLIRSLGRKLTTSDVYFLSNSFTGRGLALAYGASNVIRKNYVYNQNVSSVQYMEAMRFLQSITYGAAAITEPRDSAHPYNSFNSLLSGNAYLWLEETCKYYDIYKQVPYSTAFGRDINNLEITSIPLGSTNTTKSYPTGWLTAVASGKGTDPRVAVAWDVFRSKYKPSLRGENEMNEVDQAFADKLISSNICFEVGNFGTSGTTTLSLSDSAVQKIITGHDVAQCIYEIKNRMITCINESSN